MEDEVELLRSRSMPGPVPSVPGRATERFRGEREGERDERLEAMSMMGELDELDEAEEESEADRGGEGSCCSDTRSSEEEMTLGLAVRGLEALRLREVERARAVDEMVGWARGSVSSVDGSGSLKRILYQSKGRVSTQSRSLSDQR